MKLNKCCIINLINSYASSTKTYIVWHLFVWHMSIAVSQCVCVCVCVCVCGPTSSRVVTQHECPWPPFPFSGLCFPSSLTVVLTAAWQVERRRHTHTHTRTHAHRDIKMTTDHRINVFIEARIGNKFLTVRDSRSAALYPSCYCYSVLMTVQKSLPSPPLSLSDSLHPDSTQKLGNVPHPSVSPGWEEI